MEPTTVTFPDGALADDTTIVAVCPHASGSVVILQNTPFHPVDHTWPDQPGDVGTLTANGSSTPVVDTVMVAFDSGDALAVGVEIPVKRGAEGWDWHVGHIVADAAGLTEGAEVHAQVDTARREGLSRGHTACHLASLALDAAVADLWRKEIRPDTLGSPDFEGQAGQSSKIHEDGAVDTYRLGKSLRKAGFDSEGFANSLDERQAQINATLASWVDSAARSWIETGGDTITDRRVWHCALPEGEAEFLCGGTHVDGLDEFAAISVELDLSDPQLLVMKTTVIPAPPA